MTGGPGTGKSALFARLARELGQEDCIVLAHAAGISPLSGSVDNLLRRWIQVLSRHLRIVDESSQAAGLTELQKIFAELLSRASVNQRVICLMDALNQFERSPAARHLTWLPEIWPENARLIATAIPGEETNALNKRSGVNTYTLPLLDEKEAVDIIQAICLRYHKTLQQDLVTALLSNNKPDGTAAAGNPLWLSIALEELMLLDEDDFTQAGQFTGSPEEQLYALLLDTVQKLPPAVEEIYGYLLQRAEKRFGIKWVQGVLNFLAASRYGLREEDLRNLLPGLTGLPWDDLRFAALRRYLRAHLIQRGTSGLWDFTHAQMRICLTRKLLANEEEKKRTHRLLADHLETLAAVDPLRQTELMYHYLQADEKLRAAMYYGSELTEEELAGATRVLSEAISEGIGAEMNPRLDWTISLLKIDGLAESQLRIICNNFNFYLHDALSDSTNVTVRINLLEENCLAIKELCRRAPDSANYARDLSVSYDKLGDLLLQLGELTQARDYYQESLALCEELRRWVPDSAQYARDLSVSYERLGDLYLQLGELTRARDYYQEVLAIFEELRRRAPDSAKYARDLSVSYNNLGDLYLQLGELTRARDYYQEGLALREELRRRAPDSAEYARDLSVSYNNLGNLHQQLGELTRARDYYQEGLALREELRRRVPDSADYSRGLSVSYYKIASLNEEQKNELEAIKNWDLCKKALLHMKEQGMYLDPPLEDLLQQLTINTPAGHNNPRKIGQVSYKKIIPFKFSLLLSKIKLILFYFSTKINYFLKSSKKNSQK
ncbi:MAG: lipoprotein NlpI [Pelotomaculum sp. PtaU1.Bin035]|nr:MAG: lipoprotein NlpI [Pelotomaculum sp. PtaU1.Bin035]